MKLNLVFGADVPEVYRPFLKATLTNAGVQLSTDADAELLVLGKELTPDLAGKSLRQLGDYSQVFTSKDLGKTLSGLPVRTVADVAASGGNLAARVAGGYKPTIVAVTACPTGVAHTFMSRDALLDYGKAQGWNIRVETRGQQGVGNELSPEEVAKADVVIAATDIEVDLSKFAGKPLLKTSTGRALKKTAEVFDEAFTSAVPYVVSSASPSKAAAGTEVKKDDSIYRHLMTGVSHMLPITVAGGLCIALSFLFGIEAFKEAGTLPAALMEIGGGSAFKIMLAVFSGYVAYSIADRPGLGVGLITGFMAASGGSGFIGAIITGFLSGYVVRVLNRSIKLPDSLQALKPILILPLLGSLIVGLFTYFVISAYVPQISASMEEVLKGLSDSTGVATIAVGALLGGMMCVDMGGPINKAAYVVSVGLLGSGVSTFMAAVMAGGMVPPIGMAIATWLARRKFTTAQRESGNVAFVLGMCFISEGAIPFAAADPIRVIVSSVIGGAVAGAISMFYGIQLLAPHGGIFVMFTVNHVLMYFAAVIIGSIVTGVLYSLIKPAAKEEAVVA